MEGQTLRQSDRVGGEEIAMRAVECEQKTEEWLLARCGKITASGLVHVLRKDPAAKTRVKYMAELAEERITGRPALTLSTGAMQNSSAFENHARRAYELHTETQVDQYGFVLHPTMDFGGCSPDGIVEPGGGIEIKCCQSAVHYSWQKRGTVPVEHEPQMVWNMACCESDWWDFVSYDPLAAEEQKLFIVRLGRDPARILFLQDAVRKFNEEVEEVVRRMRGIGGSNERIK